MGHLHNRYTIIRRSKIYKWVQGYIFECVDLINKDNNCEIMANILENFLININFTSISSIVTRVFSILFNKKKYQKKKIIA